MNTEQEVESYLNGNITDTKKYLKRCSKVQLLEFIELLGEANGDTIGTLEKVKETLL